MDKIYYDDTSVMPFGIGLAGSMKECTVETDHGTFKGYGDSKEEAYENARQAEQDASD